MQKKNNVDFSEVDWQKIDMEKAKFIYNEAIARLDSIHKNIEVVTNKAIRMLSFSVPILTALVGYFILHPEKLSALPLFAASVCAAIFLFVLLVLLLMILLPRGINSTHGEPSTYFKGNYYQKDTENIFKGNIQTLQQYINEDISILNLRGNLLRAALILFGFFPVITFVVFWIAVSVCAAP